MYKASDLEIETPITSMIDIVFLLIIFFVGGFTYMAAGFAYNYKMKELRGSEAVPHLAFFRDLPI